MRRRLAALLSIIIIGSLFQGMNIYGATDAFIEKHKFARTQEGIYEKSGSNLEKKAIASGAEEAAFKWEIQENQKYEFSYDVVSSTTSGEGNKVKLVFDVAGNDIKLEASIMKGEAIIPTRFTHYPHPYNGSSTTSEPSSIFEYNLSTHTAAMVQKRELSFVAGNTKIRILMDGKKIHIWTDNINKGHITNFRLDAGSAFRTATVLNGLRNFEIKPVHLTTSATFLVSKDIININDNIKPGSNPGVKVSFEKPKVFVEGQIQSIATGETATLAVWGEQRPGVKDTTRLDNERSLSFKLENGANIKDTTLSIGESNVGKVYDDGNNISLYLSKECPDDNVVEWKSLEASMLLGGKLELTGGEFLNITDRTFTPQNNGHTYLEYKVYRASEEQICIEIIPYNIRGTATYTLKEALGRNLEEGEDIALTSFVDIITRTHTGTEENKNDAISIYIPKNKADAFYQIEVDIGRDSINNKLYSQKYRFIPGLSIAPPPITQIIRANNVYVVPLSTTVGSIGGSDAIGFDLEWTAPNNTELQAILAKGDIYYELTLYDKNKVSPRITKVFRVYKDEAALINDQIKVAIHGGTPYSQEAVGQYNRTTGTFEVKRVVIQKAGEPGWESLDLAGERFEDKYDYPRGIGVNASIDYTIPGVYYLSMKGILDPKDIRQQLAVNKESSLVSLALDYAVEIIPTPSEVSIVNKSVINNDNTLEVKYDIQAENLDIRKYVKNMLEPARIYLDNPNISSWKRHQGTYEIFIYQKNNNQNYSEAQLKEAMNDPIQLKDINNNLDMTNHLEKLRQGNIIGLTYQVNELTGKQEKENFTLENLDPNQVYYLRIRLKLDTFKINQVNELIKHDTRYSIFSSTYTFTTITAPEPPKPEDKIPPTPKSIWVDSQPNNTTAILKWAPAEFVPEQGTRVYYELVRSIEAVLKENERGNKSTLEGLVADNANLVGFYTAEPNIMTIRGSTAPAELQPVQGSDSFRLADISLSPNAIYYYYVRTVYVVGNEPVRSEWIMVPVTTQPVERPIRVQVETPVKYPYNPKTETVVSFLAPIPVGANIPNDYDFGIAVQSEIEDNFRLDYAKTALASLEDPAQVPAGYRHFVYKITQLKPGRRYDIKIRIVDKTSEKPANGNYPSSLYSEKVIARTEFDQDDQDKDNKFAEYLKRYEDEVEKLRRKAYWEAASENKFSLVYKYKESYINAEMAVKNTYELQTGKDANSVTYYFPASMLERASDLNVVIHTILGNESISIRPYTLTPENEAIKEAIYQKNQKKIKDYYIKLDFIKNASAGKVNREEMLSPEISIDLALVYLDQEDILIEDDIRIALTRLIDKEREYVISQLEKELKKGVINEEVLKGIIDKAVTHIAVSHQRDVRLILRKQKYKDVAVNEIEKPILITSKLESFSVNGYYLEAIWSSVSVMQANGGFIIEAAKLGTYVFTGVAGIDTIPPSIVHYQNIISKYNLTDFFRLDAYMIKTGTTKKQLYGAVARILGARRNTDYTEYLKAKGIKGISTIGMDKVMRQDEVIYIMMQAYEKIYNRPVTSINIKNKQSVKNIGAFQAQHRAYVYAAVELKMVQNPNANVLPSKQITVEEVIKMLAVIVPK